MKIMTRSKPDIFQVNTDPDLRVEQEIPQGQNRMKIDDKLALNLFRVDKESHIQVDREICRKCLHKICTLVCPVENYKLEGGNIVFSWEGCLECGTCSIACDQGAITWDYPRGGYGICYRLG